MPYDPEIPLLDIYPDKTMIGKDTCTPVFIAALFTRHGNNLNIHQQRNDKDVAQVKMEYYLAIKNEILPFTVTWMDLEIIILSEVNQKEKDKHCMVSICRS